MVHLFVLSLRISDVRLFVTIPLSFGLHLHHQTVCMSKLSTLSYGTRLSPCTHVPIPEKCGNEDTFSQCCLLIFWLFFKPSFFTQCLPLSHSMQWSLFMGMEHERYGSMFLINCFPSMYDLRICLPVCSCLKSSEKINLR